MSIKIEITGGSIAELHGQLASLLPAAPVQTAEQFLAGVSLDTFREIAVKRFEEAGFDLALVEMHAPTPTRKRGRPKSLDPAAAIESLKGKKGNGDGASQPEPPAPEEEAEAADDEDPGSDREFVLEQLGRLYADGVTKTQVTEFGTRMAKQFGAKISMMPVDKFPEIRRELEKEFSLGD